MPVILQIVEVLGVVIQKGLDLHKSGADTRFLEGIRDIAHEIHDAIHPMHEEHCPEKNKQHPHPMALRAEHRIEVGVND